MPVSKRSPRRRPICRPDSSRSAPARAIRTISGGRIRETTLQNSWVDLLASMEIAVAIADRYDVDLGIEPELANVVNSAEKARRLIDQIGSFRLKVVLDPANLFETETLDAQRRIVAAAVDRLADRIVMAHAKDRTSEGGFTTAGKGVLDYQHYLARLKAAGFDGPIVTHGLAADEAPGVAAFLRSQCHAAGIEIAP